MRSRISPADSDARTGTVRPINRSNLECRPFPPRRLTQLRRIALDHQSRTQTTSRCTKPQVRKFVDQSERPRCPRILIIQDDEGCDFI